MKTVLGVAALAVVAAVSAAAAAGTAATGADKTILGWPDANRQVAEVMIEKYGQPDAYSSDSLEWRGRGEFKRIVVRGMPGAAGPLEQTVGYDVPTDAIGLLSLQGCAVVIDRSASELT